jgi:hypothetical protein
MTTIEEEVSKAKIEAQKQQAEAERLVKLAEAFPDLKKHTGRWGKVAYYSASVNERVTDYDQRFNCGCCSDSPLEIWPYLETELGIVYSDPPSFQVGERFDYGARPYPKWEDSLRKAKIPEPLLERIKAHFDSCRDEGIESIRHAFLNPTEEPEPFI